MKRVSQIAYFSTVAAVAALVLGRGAAAQADVLTWDANGTTAPLGQDGSGTWDNTSPNWVSGDLVTGTNVSWTSGTGVNSAVFGNGGNTVNDALLPNNVSIQNNITVQDISLGTGSDGSVYNLDDFAGGSLTLNGNITKTSSGGLLNISLGNNLTLSSGNHTIGLRDTPGDLPELTINNALQGTGNLVLDNGSQGYESWGTLVLNTDSTFTGSTTVTMGRLVITSGNALSSNSTGVIIGGDGTLSIGGASTHVTGLTLNQPITISRSDYSSDADHQHYPYAMIFQNGSGSHTISGPLTVDSTDARLSVNTSTVNITQPFVEGPDVASGSSVITFTGDFAGFVQLTADNSAYPGTFRFLSAVEVQPASQAALGGPNSKLQFNGDATLKAPPDMSSFGTHVVNYSSFSGGLDIPQGQTFTVDQALSGGTGLGKRGTGTLNINASIDGTGTIFWDGGAIYVNSPVTFGSLHLRSPVVNIGSGGSVTTTSGYDSFGQDSTGTNGGPDIATVNLTGTGQLVEASGDDFNISDNANTQGTINIHDSAAFTTGGITWLGKGSGAVGTINQDGGTVTINRSGNFALVLGDGRFSNGPTGYYNMSGGSLNVAGEMYVGEGATGVGFFNMSGGSATINNWLVVGREGAQGTIDLSGGTLTRSGGGNMPVGEGSSKVNTVTVRGTGVLNLSSGEMWIGNGGGVGVLNIGTLAGVGTNTDSAASVTVNTWLAIGRGGGTGTLNMYGGTLTQQSSNWFDIGAGGTGTANVYGGTINALQTYIGEVGGGSGTLNINGGTVSLGTTILANANTVSGTINLNGGRLTSSGFTANNGGGTGPGTFVFNGGVLLPAADATNFIGAKVTSVVSTGGATIDTNGFTVRVNSALTHDASLSGADGGLTKDGAGILNIAGNISYTGPTTVNAGTLQFTGNSARNLSSLTIASGAALDLSGGRVTVPSAGFAGILADIQGAYDGGRWDASNPSVPLITSTFARTHSATGIGYGVSGSSLTLSLTWLGDVDLNGVVNAADFAAMQPMASGATWSNGDFNYDGKVNADDWAMANLGLAVSGGTNIGGLVPEPAALPVLALPALAALASRRRRTR